MIPFGGWTAARQIALDQRFHRRQIKAANKDESEIARISKTVFVERLGFVEIPFLDGARSRQTSPEVVLIPCGRERVEKCEFRFGCLVRQ